VSDCERLLVDGTLNGEVSDTERLEIAESGRFSGTAVVGECTVAGVIEGDLTVRGLLSIRKGGRVRGTIRYGDVEIARGGRLVGRVETTGVREAGDASARNRAAEGARTTPSGTDLQPA
jgi:cytoskeletal protein CcmA (bactofilin family)